ncbi:MAG: peptide-methionine (R)-S-oxide reductase MsrB [Candidatus Dormibacteria bacterium]|jgi:peptide-methionine (R)-S-oxide reductase
MADENEKEAAPSEDQWRSRLSPQEYRVLREKGTDPPFRGPFTHPGQQGVFRCAGCGAELFSSDTQFDSGSGWPSFTAPVDPERVALDQDRSLGSVRTEVMCSRCGGHLGHVFDDGPDPTGQRWCINSTSLKLEQKPES